MIFVTIGQMLPFDRLIRAVDVWAGTSRHTEIIAQIGDGTYQPRHFPWVRKLTPGEFNAKVREADAVVTHAGMGTMITALDFGTSLVIMPRRVEFKEVTNDHQVATARHWAQDGRIAVAFDETELIAILDRLSDLKPAGHRRNPETDRLLAAIRRFIDAG